MDLLHSPVPSHSVANVYALLITDAATAYTWAYFLPTGYTTTHSSQRTDGLVGWSDSDYAQDINTRRSTTGYVFVYNGTPITWKSQLQTTVALSSTEAELMALSEAGREAIALRQLATSLDIFFTGPTILKEDNDGAKALSSNPVKYAKTKHMHFKTLFHSRFSEERNCCCSPC
jgi:hypothetical protein